MHVDVNNRLKSPFVCNPYTTLQTEDCKQRIGLTKSSSDADAMKPVDVDEDKVVELVNRKSSGRKQQSHRQSPAPS